MARKYLRGLSYVTGSNGRDCAIFMRILYDFWGYCVNGTSSLTTPGGMPTTPTSVPAGFFEGASVVATGNDGVTSDLGINFTSLSASFNQSMVGKHITIWSHTDPNSTDNSIYRILNIISSTQMIISPFSGGTKDNTTLKNNLTSRSALNYRIIDVVAASQLGINNGNYFVGTLGGASNINPGQANSQFQFILRGSSQNYGSFGITASPAGTWNGSTFTGNTIAERVNTNNIGTSNGSGVNGAITIVADTDFIMAHMRSNGNMTGASGMYFYVIVPQRMYLQSQDPNPLALLVGANNLTASTGNDSHATSFYMVHNDGVSRACQLMTRNFAGDGTVGGGYTIGPNLTPVLSIQTKMGLAIYGEAIISHTAVSGQFSLARARLRNLGFTSSIFGSFLLFGADGEYIHMGNGVLWPWDGSVMPYSLLPFGA